MWRADRRQAFSSVEYGRPQVGCHRGGSLPHRSPKQRDLETIWKHTRKRLISSLSNKSWSVSERPNQSQWFQMILMFLFCYCITTKWQDWKCHWLWNPQAKKGAILDIKLTQAKHKEIVTNLLCAHAISGCDTVACYLGIGKGRVIKHLKEGCDLSAIGNVDAPLQHVIDQANCFISACYGMKDSTDMSHTRPFIFSKLGFSSTNEGGIHRKCECMFQGGML